MGEPFDGLGFFVSIRRSIHAPTSTSYDRVLFADQLDSSCIASHFFPFASPLNRGDYMQGTSLKFRSKEDAIHFCEKQGWDYHVTEPKVARIPPKSYAANYNHIPGKLRIHHTK